ncbi:Cys-tRNA(Pro) deacylase [Pseudonocardia nematodicida]|uniref:Cys-tRNA(Pro)/Cys-tRNA(Cys) deacylase n=1 Tax=Pseudonocardia nematodicida TaxID=1206997 RepID=A0ABV1K8F9_9PSEU
MAGKGTPATALLSRRKVPHEIHTYPHGEGRGPGSGYGAEAAEAMGQDPRRVFKTLIALVDGVMTVGIVPVSTQLDLKALAAAAGGKKAVLAVVADAERTTGYVAGGISPLGQRTRLPTVLDASAREHPTVFCSGGRRGLEIELAPADLVTLTGAVVAPIARPESPG